MISQQQTQKQQLKILPQQIQLLNLYFLNTLELEQRIKNELEENPFLDATTEEATDEAGKTATDVQDYQDWDEYGYDDVPDYKHEYQNYFSTEQTPNMALSNVDHFKDDAKQQLRLLDITEEEREVAEYIIDVLNNQGLMDKQLDEVADDYSFHKQSLVDVEIIRKGLSIVQTLDPIGIGACNIQECLLIQLKAMDSRRPDVKYAAKLVQDHYNDLMHRQFEKIHHALNIDEEELRVILNFIGSLKFYPVSETASSCEPKNTIIPDFIITRYGDTIQVHLYSSRSGAVFVNQSLYDQLAQQCSAAKDRSSTQYVKSKLQSAQWFVNAVKQREDTMLRIMQCIVNIQRDYFEEGDIRLLKPMVLRNVADMSGLDISTVSRITSNKYAETHFGLLYLKDLFSEGIADKKGEVISNKVIQSVIEEAISGEDKRHPYTDQQLVNILSAKGYNIARRTVAKYREQLRIPIAQIRAVWA
ncbi:RNA polymerase factor sigma-54 [Polluticoccus soli]|uniref:RNA polymerase factor sigma-54 n=1 Tax=Polluticoccus soli TaxID=3034150 RepID=UPI0023E3239B|nr:RNA polymerase factor sigma-54 [Flavipsychrobacter sp. JY13-12]